MDSHVDNDTSETNLSGIFNLPELPQPRRVVFSIECLLPTSKIPPRAQKHQPLEIVGTNSVDCFIRGNVGCYYFTHAEKRLHYETEVDSFDFYMEKAHSSGIELKQHTERSFYSNNEYDFFVSPDKDIDQLVSKMKLKEAIKFVLKNVITSSKRYTASLRCTILH